MAFQEVRVGTLLEFDNGCIGIYAWRSFLRSMFKNLAYKVMISIKHILTRPSREFLFQSLVMAC